MFSTAPESYEELRSLLSGKSTEEQLLVLERIKACNHPSLAAGNKAKLEVRVGVAALCQHGDRREVGLRAPRPRARRRPRASPAPGHLWRPHRPRRRRGGACRLREWLTRRWQSRTRETSSWGSATTSRRCRTFTERGAVLGALWSLCRPACCHRAA